jgi:DNA-binding LacI/PurR family transcriptional regulator
VKVVALRQRLDHHGIASVVQDERAAAAIATEAVLRQGRQPVAFLGRITGSLTGTERCQGCHGALSAAGLPADLADASYRYPAGYAATRAALHDAGGACPRMSR